MCSLRDVIVQSKLHSATPLTTLSCRSSGSPPAVGEATSFPYSIVEIKLQTDAAPAWLQTLVSSGQSRSRLVIRR